MCVMCFVVPTVVPWYFWGESLWNAYFLAAILRYCIGLNATWSVNSFAHLWGTKPYDKRINPAENMSVAFSAVGEGFHNYHHTFPSDYATSEYGWYLNITTVFINCMHYLGQAYDMKRTPTRVVDMRKQRTGDGSSWKIQWTNFQDHSSFQSLCLKYIYYICEQARISHKTASSNLERKRIPFN